MAQPVICIGAAIIDDSFYCLHEPERGTSNPATHRRSAGGVARNIAHNLAQLGNTVELISHFGNDSDGRWLAEQCSSAGIGLSHSRFTTTETGCYIAIVSPGGELYTGASALHLENEITVSFLTEQTPLLKTASLILCDCNLSESCIAWLLEFSRANVVPCVIEPVSVAKAARLINLNLDNVLLMTPNNAELTIFCGNLMTTQVQSTYLLNKGVQNIWIRKGTEGSEFYSRKETIMLPAPHVKIVDTTGAGDAALAGWIHARLQNKSVRECLLYGHATAEIILQTSGANSDRLNTHLLETTVAQRRTE